MESNGTDGEQLLMGGTTSDDGGVGNMFETLNTENSVQTDLEASAKAGTSA